MRKFTFCAIVVGIALVLFVALPLTSLIGQGFSPSPGFPKNNTDVSSQNETIHGTIAASNVISHGKVPKAALSDISPTNILSDGTQFAMGTVSTGLSAVAGPFMTSNGVARSYSYNAHALTNYPGPVLVQTNFVSGKLYTNTGNTLQTASATVQLIGVITNGTAEMDLKLDPTGAGTFTRSNVAYMSTKTTSVLQTNLCQLSIWVPPGGIFTFTNTSVQLPNASSIVSGTGVLRTDL